MSKKGKIYFGERTDQVVDILGVLQYERAASEGKKGGHLVLRQDRKGRKKAAGELHSDRISRAGNPDAWEFSTAALCGSGFSRGFLIHRNEPVPDVGGYDPKDACMGVCGTRILENAHLSTEEKSHPLGFYSSESHSFS